MDNDKLFNLIWNRIQKTPSSAYSATIDITDLIRQKLVGFFKPTQKNKPSPVSPFTFHQVSRYLPGRLPRSWNVSLGFTGWTNSMEPTLDYGDLLLKIPYEDYKKAFGKLNIGQIGIYNYGDTKVVHRLIAKTRQGDFVFKGDNNFRPDPPVKEKQIESVVVGIIYTKNKITQSQD